MYAEFNEHKNFEDYKKAFIKAGGNSTDFIIRECWIAAIRPQEAVATILAKSVIP